MFGARVLIARSGAFVLKFSKVRCFLGKLPHPNLHSELRKPIFHFQNQVMV